MPILNSIQNQQKVPFKPPPPVFPQFYCLSQDFPNHRSYELQTLKLPNSMWIHVRLLLNSVVRERNRQAMANTWFADGMNIGSFFFFNLSFEPRSKSFFIFPSLHLLSLLPNAFLLHCPCHLRQIKGSEVTSMDDISK